MVLPIQPKYIPDVAIAQALSWKVAFKGIVSDALLDSLKQKDFESSWHTLLKRKDRVDLVKIKGKDKAVGFVSFGPPTDVSEPCSWELYGIYLHPDHWDKGLGYALMVKAVETMREKGLHKGIALWTMTENQRSRRFYEKVGFQVTEKLRDSEVRGEKFQEIRYEMV